MEYEHFSTGKSKELAARRSGSAYSLCQETALQIVKYSLLSITLVSSHGFSTVYCREPAGDYSITES